MNLRTVPRSTAEPASPLQDGRFLMLEALGRGGMGAVYRAFDREEQRLVALKVPSEVAPAGPGHPLAGEFDRWVHLRHENIVRAYEMRRAERGPIPEGSPYLVLEHVNGRPLDRALPARGMSVGLVVRLAVQVLSALAHVHANGWVHRDVKPGNVLARGGTELPPWFKLTDFGLSARIGDERPPGSFSGSLPYVAPETLLGQPIDGRSDLYAVGVMLYRLLTGELPCRGGGPREILRWHLEGPGADPSLVRAGIPDRLSRFVRRLTCRDPRERPLSAARCLALLDVRPPETRRRPRLPSSARGELASLRLALDAVRLGARRVHRLPDEDEGGPRLRQELAVWCQVRDVSIHRVGERVDKLVLRLLADRGTEGAELVRRFGLTRWLPLSTLGELPLLDPAHTPRGTRSFRIAARAIGGLVLDCAARRPVVLCFDPGVRTRLSVTLRAELRSRVDGERDAAPRRDRGGLLLVV